MENKSIGEILAVSFGFGLGLALLAVSAGTISRPVYALSTGLPGIIIMSIFGRMIHSYLPARKKPQA